MRTKAMNGLLATLVLLGMSGNAIAEPKEQVILGWIEPVKIAATGFELKAKLDSGALTSSLHATDIERFERDGEQWVRFTVHGDDDEQAEVLERPLVRDVRIKRHGAPSQRRPVVELGFCLAGREHETQFSLVERDAFLYPMLLGRRFLAEFALVDSSSKNLSGRASCQDKEVASS